LQTGKLRVALKVKTTTEHWWNDSDRRKRKLNERNLSQFHFFRNKSYNDRPALERQSQQKRPAVNHLNNGTASDSN
jgi:hypothetical protein